ncbi:MAG: PucR family transcriptional regulator ligand-binding domain-containing protein, partial [Actinomycetota bacterium]
MITVGQVLGLPGLGLEPVVEADTGLPVSWVVTSELADPTPYLEGGEVVLLTGIHSAARAHSWTDYVRRLADRGVVALGLGVGERLSYPGVPEALTAACRETGLTLFSVPERTPFLGIIRATAERRAAEERAGLETMLSRQRALTRAAVGPEGPAGVLRSLVSVLGGGWAGVCTAEAEVLERSGPGLPRLPSGRTPAELLERLRPAGLRGSLSESGPAGAVVVHPLGVDGTPRSYLVVALSGPVDPARTGVIATAVALLSLHAERSAEQALLRRRTRAGALALLLGGETRAADALLGVADDETWSTVPRVRAAHLRGSAGQ